MRFEVKGGGITAIVFALTMLSGAVFVLGLLAGYDVGRQAQIDTTQFATSYPLQSAPSSTGASDEAATEEANASVRSAPPTDTSSAAEGTPIGSASASDGLPAAGSISSKQRLPQASATAAKQPLASASIPSAATPSTSTEDSSAGDEDIDADAESQNPESGDALSQPSNSATQAGRGTASTSASVRHKPFNIQIQAAMDISSADKMMARLQKLGYPSRLVPTEIAGQRWYKIEVGPYATAEDASNAEAELREKYDATYSGVTHGSSAGSTGTDENSEE